MILPLSAALLLPWWFVFTNHGDYFGGTIILLFSYLLKSDIFNNSTVMLAFWVSQTNQIHKWAHLSKKDRGMLPRLLNKTKLIISPQLHQKHHNGKINNSYCITSGICNPILDKINFWKKLESLISSLFSFKKIFKIEF